MGLEAVKGLGAVDGCVVERSTELDVDEDYSSSLSTPTKNSQSTRSHQKFTIPQCDRTQAQKFLIDKLLGWKANKHQKIIHISWGKLLMLQEMHQELNILHFVPPPATCSSMKY
jgi:hypothetical protein